MTGVVPVSTSFSALFNTVSLAPSGLELMLILGVRPSAMDAQPQRARPNAARATVTMIWQPLFVAVSFIMRFVIIEDLLFLFGLEYLRALLLVCTQKNLRGIR